MYAAIALIALLALVGLDQLTKYWALANLAPVGTIPIINGLFNLSFVQNKGAAFGILQGARPFFIVLTILILGVALYYFITLQKNRVYTWVRVSIVIIAAGAIGNFIDRFARHYVVDFLQFVPFNFPVFNVADMYVVCGTILLAILLLFFVKEEGKTRAPLTEPAKAANPASLAKPREDANPAPLAEPEDTP